MANRDPRIAARHLDELASIIDRVGPPIWIAGPTDAALLGIDGYELARPFDFAVPRERAPHLAGHRFHRLRDLDRIDRATMFGLPCLSATRLLIESAATTDPVRLTTMLDCALRDGLTSEDFLHRRVVELRRKGRRGLNQLLAVIEGCERTRGGHSYLERRFLELLDELGYRRPLTQQVLARRGERLVRVDCHFPESGMVIELLGYRFHRSKAQMQVDAERINALQLSGLTVVQFTYDDVALRSPQMLATLDVLSSRMAA